MRLTQFRAADNNPLKFSANVDDALHNLLVKRNAAYLEPVEAFEDAFDDLRDHQIAMLAACGWRLNRCWRISTRTSCRNTSIGS